MGVEGVYVGLDAAVGQALGAAARVVPDEGLINTRCLLSSLFDSSFLFSDHQFFKLLLEGCQANRSRAWLLGTGFGLDNLP